MRKPWYILGLLPVVTLLVAASTQIDWNTQIKNKPSVWNDPGSGTLLKRTGAYTFAAASSADILSTLSPCAEGSSHTAGYVPDPGATLGLSKFLREDCTWAALPQNIATFYNFAAQSPSGTLTASTPATVTLSPVPLGVNGTDANHYLYIPSCSGGAQAVLITGGTAVSGAASGTITFTPTNSCTAGWTIQSATGGIQEAVVATPAETTIIIPGIITTYQTITDTNAHAFVGLSGGRADEIQSNFVGTSLHLTPNPPSGVRRCFVANLYFTSLVTQSSGTTLVLDSPDSSPGCTGTLNNVSIDSPNIGLQIVNTTQMMVNQFFASNCANTCMLLDGANGQYSNLNLSCANAADSCIHLRPQFTGATFTNITAFGGTSVIHFDPSIGTKVINETQWANILLDGAQQTCITFSSAAGSAMALHHFRDLHCNSNQYGVFINSNATRISFQNCYLAIGISGAGGYYGFGIIGASDVRLNGCKVQGGGNTYDSGVRIMDSSQNGLGTPASDITIQGGGYGFDSNGLRSGSRASYGVNIATSATFTNLYIKDANLQGSTAGVVNSGSASSSNVCYADNEGVSTVQPSITGAATLAFPVNPTFKITGSTNITAVSGLFCVGQTGIIIETNAAPPTWTAGTTIGNSFTPTQNVPFIYYWDGSKVWLH